MTTPTQQWSDWLPHDGGPCPIPWAKAGEFEIRRRNGDEIVSTGPTSWWGWGRDFGPSTYDIVAYRHIIRPTEAPAEPSPSLVEAAEAMAAALEPFATVGKLIDGKFGPALFAEEGDAFGGGCAWTENGERKTLTWGNFRRAIAAIALYRTTTGKE